jgi:hypothetical protein
MNPLESRKKLLLAESELNRAQLAQEWHTLAGEVHALTESAKTIGFIASAAASLVAGISVFGQNQSAPAAKKTSWLQTVLQGVGVVSKIWEIFRSARGGKSEK